jgi:hypothetical protein
MSRTSGQSKHNANSQKSKALKSEASQAIYKKKAAKNDLRSQETIKIQNVCLFIYASACL